MTTETFRHLPIIDGRGKLVNMIPQGDFAAYAWPDLFDHTRQVVRETLGIPFRLLMAGVAGVIITLSLLNK